MVQEFLAKGIPVAAQGYEGCADIPSVEPDFAGGMDQIVEHLVNLGHTRIAFITSHLANESNLRFIGYCRALASRGVHSGARAHHRLTGMPPYQDTPAAGYRMALELLERKIDLTAIIAYSDLVALGISRAVREAGLRIPGDTFPWSAGTISTLPNISTRR